MSLARFFDRTADALVAVTGLHDRTALEKRLLATSIVLRAGGHIEDDGPRTAGFLFAVDLASRLYPRIALNGSSALVALARTRAEEINPAIDIVTADDAMPTLAFESPQPRRGVRVGASGWSVVIDEDSPGGAAEATACMGAAALGVSELFRDVFADAIDHPRTSPTPASWNLITCAKALERFPSSHGTDVGRFHLAGCGAIGQAAVAALRSSGVAGTVVVVDPETVELSNLQRYVLTDDGSVDEAKVYLVERALAGTDLRVEPVRARWSADIASEADTVLVALDTADDRIRVQAGLPRTLYNAYTDERDLGWSRHEHFSVDACLACLYWPTKPRSSRVELVADALGENLGRVAGYYASVAPVGRPLPLEVSAPRGTPPEDMQRWRERSILDDVGERSGISAEDLAPWRDLNIDAFYRQGVCGAGLVELADSESRRWQVSVPLAHQSAMAGIMLAVQLIAARHDELRVLRPRGNEGRIDLLRAPVPYATMRAPTDGCLCSDDDFRDRSRARWETASG